MFSDLRREVILCFIDVREIVDVTVRWIYDVKLTCRFYVQWGKRCLFILLMMLVKLPMLMFNEFTMLNWNTVVSFMFSDLRWEVVVRFGAVGEIIDFKVQWIHDVKLTCLHLFYVQWFKERDDSSLYWFSWNCWCQSSMNSRN
jgi:hypothetical protein